MGVHKPPIQCVIIQHRKKRVKHTQHYFVLKKMAWLSIGDWVFLQKKSTRNILSRPQFVNMLYDIFLTGHEIADHSISHNLKNDYWKNGTYQTFVREIIGLREQLYQEGIKKVTGYRQPLLQTGGDVTFSVLKDFGFQYDSSLVTNLDDFYWPFTLDHKVPNCVVEPCPNSK